MTSMRIELDNAELFLYNARKGLEYMVENKWSTEKILRNWEQWNSTLLSADRKDLADLLVTYLNEMVAITERKS